MLKVAVGGPSGSINYRGTWDASTNTPFLQSSIGTQGYYYVVSVAGTTNLNGITDWQVGDWALFNGTVWQKVDNTDAVTSVNGQTGVVQLNVGDIPGAVANTTTITAGTGLSGGGNLASNVTLNIADTGVAAGTYGGGTNSASVTINAQGQVTSASNVAVPQGTVTSVDTGVGLSGGPITSSGTISLANTTISSGSYTYASITVDAQGRLTSAANGTAPVTSVSGTSPIASSGGTTPAISIPAANATTNGYLTSTDWSTFNGKQPAGTYVTSVSGTSGRISSTGGTTPTLDLVTTAVSAGSYGTASNVSAITVDAYGRITAASNTAIAINVSQVANAVPDTRTITASTGLTGGGDLTANRSFAVVANTTNQLITIKNNGVTTGSEPAINFVPSSNVTITTADDTTNKAINVTISSTIGNLNTATVNFVATTASTATFATSSLPLVPAGYFQIDLNGTFVKVPYYAV